jgi:hypothetical protein
VPELFIKLVIVPNSPATKTLLLILQPKKVKLLPPLVVWCSVKLLDDDVNGVLKLVKLPVPPNLSITNTMSPSAAPAGIAIVVGPLA